MRERLERLLENATLVVIALGIAVGYVLLDLARAVAQAITIFGRNSSGSDVSFPSGSDVSFPWAFAVKGHVVELSGIVSGLIELALVLAVAIVVTRRGSPD